MNILKKLTCCAAAALTVSSAFAQTADAGFRLGRNAEILFDLFREVNLFYVDSVDSDKLLSDAAQGMLSKLDPYTEYIPESQMGDFQILTTGKYGGIGALVRRGDDYVVIAEPYKGFPADNAGLVPGDRLVSINGEDLKGLDVTTVSSKLKGDPGSTMTLTVRKLLTDSLRTLTIRRQQIVLTDITYYGMLDDRTGYIHIEGFAENCAADFRKAFLELKAKGMASLVIDVRGNGGGILDEAVKIVGMFVPKGTEVVSIRGKVAHFDKSFATPSEPLDTAMPLVVLANGNTASAAEILAGALQDLDRAVVVGQRTFGKGLVQNTRPVGYNSYLKVTTAKYFIPSGRCIQAIDYTHRREDGSAGYTPDSLISAFHTRNNRVVYDGGGISPDILLPAEYYSLFTSELIANGYAEDFATRYYKIHRTAPDVQTFRLTDQDYADFVAYMQDKPMEMESYTSHLLGELKEAAGKEKYLDRIQAQIASIEAAIAEDKEKELALFKDEISKRLEQEILLCYHYRSGSIRHSLIEDDEAAEAVALFKDPERYASILAPQNR